LRLAKLAMINAQHAKRKNIAFGRMPVCAMGFTLSTCFGWLAGGAAKVLVTVS
jgi:hypothetical protein